MPGGGSRAVLGKGVEATVRATAGGVDTEPPLRPSIGLARPSAPALSGEAGEVEADGDDGVSEAHYSSRQSWPDLQFMPDPCTGAEVLRLTLDRMAAVGLPAPPHGDGEGRRRRRTPHVAASLPAPRRNAC